MTGAILLAFLVTFLWSTSWVLIKIGLQDIPPVTFAGIRYLLAGAVLLPGLASAKNQHGLRALKMRDWFILSIYGLVGTALTQGFQFLSISLLPAATSSLILTFTPLVVALISIPLLREKPQARHWIGMGLYGIGLLFYFQPVGGDHVSLPGILYGVMGLLTNAMGSILGRSINRQNGNAYLVTTISMFIGGSILFAAGATLEGVPPVTPRSWGIILWLAVVNGAFAFTLWNKSLQRLTATESSIIANTMLIQIAVLAWIYLGETISVPGIIGLAFAVMGTLIAQLKRKSPARVISQDE